MFRHTLTRRQAHELELALAGAFGAQPRYSIPEDEPLVATLKVNCSPDQPPAIVMLIDSESTTVGRVTVQATAVAPGGGLWVGGPIEPLVGLTAPPYGHLRPGRAPRLEVPCVLLVDTSDTDRATAAGAIIVDDGDAHRLWAAVLRASKVATDVRVLPRPAAEHVDESALADHLADIARRVFADDVTVAPTGSSARGQGTVILMTGLSGSGKSTLARGVAQRLVEEGLGRVTLLDGDEVRSALSSELGFSRSDRETNIRRIGWVASLVSAHGGVAICAPIAPYASTRAQVRTMAEAVGRFALVHVSTPLAVCEARDRKGLYARARAGTLKEFTGISDPYEEPTDADVTINTDVLDVDACVTAIVEAVFGSPEHHYSI